MRLRAVAGTPLADPLVRETVQAAAHALAERMGVTIHAIACDDASITLDMNLNRLSGLGFLAELRRTTNAWYEAKYRDGPLWGTPAP
jgi:hypothetical protein